MNTTVIVDFLLLGPVGILILWGALRLSFKNSVLFKMGFVMGLFGLVMANIIMWSTGIGTNSYFWTVPTALLSLYFSFRYLNRNIKKPLTEISTVFGKLKDGDINASKKLDFTSKDEFGDIAQSANQLIDGFTSMSSFARGIGQGNLNSEYALLSEKDTLGNSLIDMQISLIKAQEEEDRRKQEDEKHFWTNEGFAKFGELLRNNSEDNHEFYHSIISNLVKYVGANQGGLFLVNDQDEGDEHIELVAMYAYERRKYVNNRLEMGESLVGQCVLEGETIYMTDLPQDYIRITSGLGDSNPSSLILVPLTFNEKVYGVIELASFTEFADHKRNFIEKLGESIASTISTYKINLRTVKLLEDSKIQSEELAAQEEEIRQNMEELQTTQEESARREAEMSNVLTAIKSSVMLAELDLRGVVTEVNEALARYLETPAGSMTGSNWVNYLKESEEDNFAEILEVVNSGETFTREVNLINDKPIKESYHLIEDAEGFAFKIVVVVM